MNDMEKRENYIDLAERIASIDISLATGFARSCSNHEAVTLSITDVRKDQERILHILYGNGKEGLITSMAKISQKLNLMWTILSVLSMSVLALSTGIVQDWLGRAFH